MLFPLGFPALSISLDFSNEEERSCDGHNGVCSIYSIVCPFIPQTSPVKSEEWTWELDQLGRKLEYLYHDPDRGVFFRWKVCIYTVLEFIQSDFHGLSENLAGRIWLRESRIRFLFELWNYYKGKYIIYFLNFTFLKEIGKPN